MSLISFIKEAGEKLFKRSPAASAAAPSQPDVVALNATAGDAIEKYIASQNLTAAGLSVKYDAGAETATVSGVAVDQATREKIVLCCGNVSGVAKVEDRMTVASASETASKLRAVKSGDTLSKIAKEEYADANAYMKIFEANKPMLSDPDKIYPGQMLRIPTA
jgi:nucleoid-associated protein YgaU